MKKNQNYILKAVVVIALALAMIMPASAFLLDKQTTNSKLGTSSSIQIQQLPRPKTSGFFVDILNEGFETPWVADSDGNLAPPNWEVHQTCTSGTDPFQGWWHRVGTIPFTDPGPVPPHSGSWQAFVHWSYDHQDEWLVTPLISLGSNSNLEFWIYGHFGSTHLDHYYVKLSPSGGYNEADFTVTLWDASAQPVGDNFYNTPVDIDLSNYDGQSIRLAWNFVDGDGQGLWHATAIDDVLVTSSGGIDTNPPVTTCILEGDLQGGIYRSDVKVTLNATDDNSGVNYTKYKVDGGTWMTYSAPFYVKGNGNHTVAYYSIDKAGNIETEKYANFTMKYPIEITIKGGIGVSMTVKNTGTTNMTNLTWTITLDGKLIFIGKSKSDTIDSLPAGESVTVKSFIVGFGATQIIGDCGGSTGTKSGKVLLILVIGVT